MKKEVLSPAENGNHSHCGTSHVAGRHDSLRSLQRRQRHPTIHLLWTKQDEAMMEQKKHNIRARSVHSGCTHCLAKHTEALLAFIFELQEKGMGVTIPMVAVKAAQISKSFNDKTRLAQYHSARRFVCAQGLVFRLGTYKSQSSHQEVITNAMNFIVSVVRPKVLVPTRHQDNILNMDQTPVPFTYNVRKTLEIVGVALYTFGGSLQAIPSVQTFAMTVTASRKVLKPVINFKGTQNG